MKLFGFNIGGERKNTERVTTLRDIIEGLQLSSKAGVAVSWQTALQITTAFACARVIADGLAQVPFKLFQDNPNGGKTAATGHGLYNLLATRPNEWQTSYEMREQIALHLVFCNNAYIWKNRVRGQIVELLAYEPQNITVKRDSNWQLSYEVDTGSRRIPIPAEDMWHIRGPSWNGWQGLDAIKLAREALGLALATEEHSARMFSNGARVGGILTTEGTPKKEDRDEMRTSWQALQGGLSNAFKTALLWGGIKYTPTAQQNDQAQLIEQRRFQIEEICRFARVLPIMVGHYDKSATFASAEQMFLAHVVHTMGPWYARLEQSADASLLSETERAKGLYFKFMPQALMRGAHKDRAEYFAKALGAGGSPAWMTQDEVRALDELNPQGGDADQLPIATNVPAAASDAAADAAAKTQAMLTEVKQILTAFERKNEAVPVSAPQWHLNVPIDFKAGPTTVNLPEGMVRLENNITTPEVTTGPTNIDVHPAAVANENHIHLPEAKAGPQEVAIVSLPGIAIDSLPDRKTESDVERDRTGNIIKTTQLETDT